MGQATFQVIYTEDKSRIAQVEHFPVETLRMEKCNEDGDVEAYWYSKDWTKIRKKGYEPERIPAFGYGELVIRLRFTVSNHTELVTITTHQ